MWYKNHKDLVTNWISACPAMRFTGNNIKRLRFELAHLIDNLAIIEVTNQHRKRILEYSDSEVLVFEEESNEREEEERTNESPIILSLGMALEYRTYHPPDRYGETKNGHVLECLRMDEIGLTGPMFSVRLATKGGK
jgi:hypothetical protein